MSVGTVIIAAMFGVLSNSQDVRTPCGGVGEPWTRVPPRRCIECRVRCPSAAEVSVKSGVSGRFYAARSLYILSIGSTRFPVCGRASLSSSQIKGWKADSHLRPWWPPQNVWPGRVHARPLLDANGVNAYVWHPGRQHIRSTSPSTFHWAASMRLIVGGATLHALNLPPT